MQRIGRQSGRGFGATEIGRPFDGNRGRVDAHGDRIGESVCCLSRELHESTWFVTMFTSPGSPRITSSLDRRNQRYRDGFARTSQGAEDLLRFSVDRCLAYPLQT